MVEKPCIYCAKEAKGARADYHILPYSAGNISDGIIDAMILPTGIVCDKCNQYFGSKLEPHLTGHPDVQLWRVLHGIKGRAKTLEHKSAGLKLSQKKHKILLIEENINRELMVEPFGVINIKRPSLNKVNHVLISRALHKIAFEYESKTILDGIVAITAARHSYHGIMADNSIILFEDELGAIAPMRTCEPPVIKSTEILNIEKKHYINPVVTEITRKQILSSDYDHIRKYVREPRPNEYRPYGIARGGGTAANVARMSFRASDDPAIVGPSFNSYVITLPGVRFVVTTAQDPNLLNYTLGQITRDGMTAWMGASEVYWDAIGSVIKES
ncbi:MAG: HNH endonuclease [Nitrospirae bacterium]|nr:HNH endonuclease [Nitrospirota bacterium]